MRDRYASQRTRLYEGYRDWCLRNGRMAVSQQSFAPRVRQLLRREIAVGAVGESASASAGRPWKGIGLRA